jgi:hypothetical protein
VQVFGQQTYSIEPESIGRELYWHQAANVFSRPKFYVLEHPSQVPQPLYWHRCHPFNVPKYYILDRVRTVTPQPGGGWFDPPDPDDRLDFKAIEKDDRDFINILIMVFHGMNGRL